MKTQKAIKKEVSTLHSIGIGRDMVFVKAIEKEAGLRLSEEEIDQLTIDGGYIVNSDGDIDQVFIPTLKFSRDLISLSEDDFVLRVQDPLNLFYSIYEDDDGDGTIQFEE